MRFISDTAAINAPENKESFVKYSALSSRLLGEIRAYYCSDDVVCLVSVMSRDIFC